MRNLYCCGLICLLLSTYSGCFKDRFEPNDTAAAATPAETGAEPDLSVDSQDQDWFRVQLAQNQMATVGVRYFRLPALGSLSLNPYNEELELLYDTGSHLAPGLSGMVHENLSVLSLSGQQNFFFEVTTDGAPMTYEMRVAMAPYTDGCDCEAQYETDECIGRVNGEAKLYHFPLPDQNDDFLGEGYTLATYSNYLWARRETIMYIRCALHEVQLMFPGTNPVAIIDISQQDGLTPGWDVGSLRHPESTHDQGSNVDLSYYQTGPDNNARTICDGEGGSNNGYYCDESAANTHIVDLERCAYFVAKLASLPTPDNPRLRVVGVDRVIGPLLDAAVLDLKDQGVISEEEYTNAYNRIAYGDGWPFHHHHMHISFQWWDDAKTPAMDPPVGCGFRMPGDPPL